MIDYGCKECKDGDYVKYEDAKQLQTKLEKAKEALHRYGSHDADCMIKMHGIGKTDYKCTCGYSEAFLDSEVK